MLNTFICIHFDYLFLDIVMYIFIIAKDNYSCELCIYIVSFIIILAARSVYCLCIRSLLIYVDRLFDFMSVSKYGSSSGRAVGPTFKLGPIRICVRLEYSRRSSIDDEIIDIYIV